MRPVTPYYTDDHVTLYHGDARIVSGLANFDVLLTDPPYGLAAQYGRPGGVRRTIAGDADTSLLEWVSGRVGWFAADAWSVVFCGWNGCGAVQDAMTASGLTVKTVIVWDKMQPGIGSGVRDQHEFAVLGYRGEPPRPWHGGNVWRISKVSGRPVHPNEKPVELMRTMLGRLTDKPIRVLDPFAGSGSTLVAAKALGHTAVGVEIDERHCEVAANRLRQEVLGLVA
jgi:DNA modification methylase